MEGILVDDPYSFNILPLMFVLNAINNIRNTPVVTPLRVTRGGN